VSASGASAGGVACGVVSDRFARWDPDHRRRPAEVTVTPARPADLPALVALAAGQAGSAARWAELLETDLADLDRVLLVGRVGDALAGYGRLAWLDPPASGGEGAPAGWYLAGLVVDPAWRGRGVGEALTRARIEHVAGRAGELWYFANAANTVSLVLHAQLGFVEITRDFSIPGVSFTGGTGVLCRLALASTLVLEREVQGRARR